MPILIEYEFLLILIMFFFYFFIYGSIGFLKQKNNFLRILFFFEMLIFVISFMFLIITLHYNDIYGHLVVMYLLTIAAVEAAVGLALLYLYYRAFGSIRLQSLSKIKG